MESLFNSFLSDSLTLFQISKLKILRKQKNKILSAVSMLNCNSLSQWKLFPR